MTDAQRVAAVAYDDPSTPSELAADCREAEARLTPAPDLQRAARAATQPAPSMRFEDYPQDVVKPEIHVAAAARRIATALGLDLD
jgi:hypothetical protein